MENFMGRQKKKIQGLDSSQNFNFLGSWKLIWAVYKVKWTCKVAMSSWQRGKVNFTRWPTREVAMWTSWFGKVELAGKVNLAKYPGIWLSGWHSHESLLRSNYLFNWGALEAKFTVLFKWIVLLSNIGEKNWMTFLRKCITNASKYTFVRCFCLFSLKKCGEPECCKSMLATQIPVEYVWTIFAKCYDGKPMTFESPFWKFVMRWIIE
jgi:hypothetical protein